MDTVGPISRSAEDCALTFQAIAGHDPQDPYSWNTPVPDYRREIEGGVRGLRVGVLREKVAEGELQPDVRSAIEAAIGQLGELGAPVEEVSIPLVENAGAVSKAITDMDGASVHYRWLKERAAEYDHNTRVRLLTAILTPAQAYYKAQKVRTLIRQAVLEALEEVDVIVLPTSPTVAPLLPDEAGIKSQEDARSRIAGVRNFTGAFNAAGVPALSIPCGFSSPSESGGNLPLSLQIVGKPMADGLLMRVAHAYQQVTDWHLRRPPLGE
jgi:aspartyl-tRNA(Asn)/glutamyl-tRNA(Gln) amidotransferase subunit A